MSDLVGNPEDRFSHDEAHIDLDETPKMFCSVSSGILFACQTESGYPNVCIKFQSSNEISKMSKKGTLLCRKYFHTIKGRDKHDLFKDQ